MSNGVNRKIVLKERPERKPTHENFDLVEEAIPSPEKNQVLCKTLYLSVDPYMLAMMTTRKSYADPIEIGGTMVGASVGEVIESNDTMFEKGDIVLGSGGWQEYFVDDPSRMKGVFPSLLKIEDSKVPLSYYLGILGMPGLTAYIALLDFGKPNEGETLLVSSAAGAVGTATGQIGKIKGLNVIGTAGSDEKCDYVVNELGFDACINYKKENLLRSLARHCRDGIDIYVDNVGGDVLMSSMRLINRNARIVVVGAMSQYNEPELPPGPNLIPLIMKRATIAGMLVFDHPERIPPFISDMTRWLSEGKIKVKETIYDGIEKAPDAFIGLFKGENIGKAIVKAG
ncbi:MAG TPA: NADP-dependent oxidoreductase [bacterium]|jgi:hypothetical protein